MSNIFTELKRRNIFRVAGVYAVVGWLIAQIAAMAATSFGAPDWVMKMIIVVITLGFPIAMILAWAFEMTPEGVRRTEVVNPDESIAHKTGRKLEYAILAGLVCIGGLLAIQTLKPNSPSSTSEASVASDASIAVLPFADLSPAGDQEYFGDGISEELLNVMAQVQGLDVAGRTSSFAFKGQNRDLREIAEILDVAHVLEGSVRKSGDKVRVTAQLIRAENGFHLWSDTYDGDLSDIFAFQDEIANSILIELKPMLLGDIKPVSTLRTDISAYDLYLLAQQKAAYNTQSGYEGAVGALDKALAIDPDFVKALAWRGYYELMLSDGYGAAGDIPVETATKNATIWINRALDIDPNSADSLFAKAGLISMNPDQNKRKKAGAFYEQALALKPNFALARNDYGFWLGEQGRIHEAYEQYDLALAHDPAQGDVNINLITGYVRQFEFDKAQKLIDRWRAIAPHIAEPIYLQGSIAFQQGHMAEGIKLRRQAFEIIPESGRALNGLGGYEVSLGVFERALATPDETPLLSVIALIFQGKKDDALSVSRKALSERPDYNRIRQLFLEALHQTGEWDEIIRYYDNNWDSADAFDQAFINPPFGYLIPALKEAGHPDTAALLKHARAIFEKYKTLGDNDAVMDNIEARLLLLEGKPNLAMDVLDRAFSKGARDLYWFVDPVFAPLRGTKRFDALKTNTNKAINAERAKLDLPPMEMPEPLFNVDK